MPRKELKQMPNNYLTYPSKIMRITQSYDGQTSHLPHMTGTPKEFALDEGEKDGGRGWFYCGCASMRVAKLTGVGSKGTNALYLTSTTPVKLANRKESIITLQLVHPNDDDLKKLHEGQIFRRGDRICREGTDGTSANHVHLAVGLGTIVGTGWQKNSKGKWVLVTTGGPIKPEDAFFIDPDFTTVKDSKGLKFETLPMDKPAPGTYEITANVLNVRTGTTQDARVADVLIKGAKVKVDHVKTGYDGDWWGKIIGKGWIAMRYAKKVGG